MSSQRHLRANATLAVEFDEKKIDSIFAELDQCRLPGAAIGIAIGGRPVYRRGFGLCSMEQPLVLSPTTRMRIGSTTKHFTCLAYMLLCEDGRAEIDDPIGKYLPNLHVSARGVTLRQLMGNVSGLHCACTLKFLFSGLGGPTVSSDDIVSFYSDIDVLNTDPGTAWIYNNGGFVLLSAVIEKITGRTLEDVLRERIFEPVGMYDTMLRRSDRDFVANSATPHMKNAAREYERSYWGLDFAGGGAMVSTVNDMLRWLSHMDAPKVGSQTTWSIMKSPQILANGTSTGYGLGLMIGRYRNTDIVCHPGGWLGSNAQMLKVPAAGLDVVVLVNREDVSSAELANGVLAACLPDLRPINGPNNGPDLSGTFRSPTTRRVIQLLVKDGQQIVSIGGIDIPAERDDRGVLRPAGTLDYMKFAVVPVGDSAEPMSIRLDDFGNVDELVAVGSAGSQRVDAIVGRYRSDTTDTYVTIHEVRKRLQMISVGRFGSWTYALECLADGIWRAKSHPEYLSGILSFDADGAAFRHFSGPSTISGLCFRKI